MRRKASDIVHRATGTTSKSDEFDLGEAVYKHLNQSLVDDFKSACKSFKREVETLEHLLALNLGDTAVSDSRRRLERFFRELEDVSTRLCERSLKPTRAVVEQALLHHRGSERLTGHDQRLIAAAFGDLSLETVERDMAAAHASYAQLMPDAPSPNPMHLPQLRRT